MSRKKEQTGIVEKRMTAGCILLVLSILLLLAAGKISGFAQWYASYIYPVIVAVLGRFSGLFSQSLAELCLYALLLLLAGTLIHALASAFRTKKYGAALLKWLSGIFLTASILAFLYVANCGINYRRNSFSEEASLRVSEYSREELKEVCLWLTGEVNERAGQVKRDSNQVMVLSKEVEPRAVKAMKKLGTRYPALAGYYPSPKPVLVSQILSYQSLTGVYSPFTVEANYNQDMPAYDIPFTACHELSHLRGFMQEEEANFIAFLACTGADQIDFQYSGYLSGWVYSMNALRRADAELWQEVRMELALEAEADLTANDKFWAEYDGVVAEVSNTVNDTYLKANGQQDGVMSYGRMVDLIMAYYEKM